MHEDDEQADPTDAFRAEFIEDPEVLKTFRSQLEEDVRSWKLEWLRYDQEVRSKRGLLLLSNSPAKLRVAGIKARSANGPIDFNGSARNELNTRLGSLVFQMEILEHSIRDAEDRLAELPEAPASEDLGTPAASEPQDPEAGAIVPMLLDEAS